MIYFWIWMRGVAGLQWAAGVCIFCEIITGAWQITASWFEIMGFAAICRGAACHAALPVPAGLCTPVLAFQSTGCSGLSPQKFPVAPGYPRPESAPRVLI